MGLHSPNLGNLITVSVLQAGARIRRPFVLLVFLGILPVQAPAFAEGEPGMTPTVSARPAVIGQSDQGSLATVVARSMQRLPQGLDAVRLSGTSQGVQRRNWIGRHPMVFGALVGAGVGAGIGYTTGKNCEGSGDVLLCYSKRGSAMTGAAVFAGVGALVGFVVDRATR